MKHYSCQIRNTFIDALFFRSEFLLRTLANLLIMLAIYYLWKAIYANGNLESSGMTFPEAFLYLAASTTLFTMIETGLDLKLSRSITWGEITMRLHLPLDLHISMIFQAIGSFLLKMLTSGIPGLLFIILVFRVPLSLGVNIPLFFLSIFFALLIAVNLDFAVGVSAFSFESIVGLKLIKDSVILFFAGAVVPLPLFPPPMQRVLMYLPFQAMIHTPVKILLNKQPPLESLKMLGVQLIWICIFVTIGRLFYRKIMTKLTINGG